MPELPEVETIRSQLEKEVLNEKIKEIVIKDKRLIKDITPAALKTKAEGRTIEGVFRRGKVLILKLGKNIFLVLHLRISGWIVLSGDFAAHSRVALKLSDSRILNFCDSRVLGEIKLVEDWREMPIVKTMGPEPFELKKKDFTALFEGKKTKIKPLLMDQTFIAGIGNLYAQEALFCAGIHPEKAADKVGRAGLEKLYDCTISILKSAIAKKGSSVDTYRQISGDGGEYISCLKVYQREGEPCFNCNNPIEKKTVGGRGTCFCPRCQK